MQQWEKSTVKTCWIFGINVIHIFYEMILNLLYLHLKPMAGYMEPSSWILYHWQFRFLHFPPSYSLIDLLFEIVFQTSFFENKCPSLGLCFCVVLLRDRLHFTATSLHLLSWIATITVSFYITFKSIQWKGLDLHLISLIESVFSFLISTSNQPQT
jgi:hypothetical protein